MSLLKNWLTRNWSDTAEPGDESVHPQRLNLPPEAAWPRIVEAVARLPRWEVQAADASSLRAVRRSRLFRFADDVTIRLEPDNAGGALLNARSASRVGRGDFGQNRRNLLELFAALGRAGLLRKGDA